MAFTINGTTGLTFPNATQQPTASFTGANTNAVSSSAITLTSSSPQYQVAQISSFTNSYITLPDATQVGLGSNPYVIENRSPYGAKLEIRNNAGTTVGYIPIGQIATVQLKDASTAAGQWAVELVAPQTFFNYNGSSITSTTTTPLPAGFNYTNGYGIVGLTATTFVRWWIVTTWTGSATTTTLYTQVGAISGSTISFGSIQSTSAATSNGPVFYPNSGNANAFCRVIRLSNTAFVAMTSHYYRGTDSCGGGGGSTASTILTSTVSGTVVTFGAASSASLPSLSSVGDGTISNSGTSLAANGTVCRLSDTSYALVYNDGTVNTYTYPYNYGGSVACQIVTVSGTTQTIGAKVTLATSTYSQIQAAVGLSSTSLFLCYAQAAAAGGSVGRTKMIVVSVSGTTPTFNTAVSIESSDIACFNTAPSVILDAAVAPSATQVVFGTGYSTGEATVSGTVPTFDSFPYSARLQYMYLCTSSKAYAKGVYGAGSGSANYYLNIATGGFVTNTPVTNILQTNLTVQSANPYSPLGAQPTTAFVGYNDNANGLSSSSVVILGNTT